MSSLTKNWMTVGNDWWGRYLGVIYDQVTDYDEEFFYAVVNGLGNFLYWRLRADITEPHGVGRVKLGLDLIDAYKASIPGLPPSTSGDIEAMLEELYIIVSPVLYQLGGSIKYIEAILDPADMLAGFMVYTESHLKE